MHPDGSPVEVDSNKPLLGEDDPKSFDQTALISEVFGVQHPYLISDVEPYSRETVMNLRDDAHTAFKEMWKEEALGKPADADVLPLPTPRHGGETVS